MIKREVKGNSLSMGEGVEGSFNPGDFQARLSCVCRNNRRGERERNGGKKPPERESEQSGEKVAESRWVDIGCILFIN